MINKELLANCKKLYEKIFFECIEDSKEFLTFVNEGNPHPLRLKIDEELININEELYQDIDIHNSGSLYSRLIAKRNLLKDLEKMIMEYIEDNN